MSDATNEAAAAQPALSAFEKKYYVMGLLTLVSADGAPGPQALEIMKGEARRLKVRLHDEDFHKYDLAAIAQGIKHDAVRKDLFEKMIKLGSSDEKWTPGELSIVKFYAESWKQPLPALAGVDWATVAAPDAKAVEKHTSDRKPVVHAYYKTHVKDSALGNRQAVLLGVVVALLALAGIAKFGVYDGMARSKAGAARASVKAFADLLAAGPADKGKLAASRHDLEEAAVAGGLPLPPLADPVLRYSASATQLIAATLLPVGSVLEGNLDRCAADEKRLADVLAEVTPRLGPTTPAVVWATKVQSLLADAKKPGADPEALRTGAKPGTSVWSQ